MITGRPISRAHVELSFKGIDLALWRGMTAEKIQPDLSPGHDLRRSGQVGQIFQSLGIDLFGMVGVISHRSKWIKSFSRLFQRLCENWQINSDRNDLTDPCLQGSCQAPLAVFFKFIHVQVSMGVDEHVDAYNLSVIQ
jgi:hypothetical protein